MNEINVCYVLLGSSEFRWSWKGQLQRQ